MKNSNDKYNEENSKVQDVNESVDNSEASDTFRDDIIIKTTKEKEALIQRLS